MSLRILLLFILFLNVNAAGQPAQKTFRIHLLSEEKPSGFRGMSVVSDSVLWVCGSKGYIGCSKDGGHIWNWMQIPHAENLDFRSIKAFDSLKAIVVNAGSPAYIFLTADGGRHWEKVYENRDEDIFLDGITFWNKKRGLVYGDPIKDKSGRSRFVLLKTKDGGRRWKMVAARHRPVARQGEASFAASGTAVFSLLRGLVWIGTGGMASRILFSRNYGKRWETLSPPALHGKNSTGIFSLAFRDKAHGICAGGDYSADSVRLGNAFLTNDGGKTWIKPVINPLGYRSCVIYISDSILVATGTSGTDISLNGGMVWRKLSPAGFHVVQKSPGGRAVYLAGADGRIARLEGLPVFPQYIQEKRSKLQRY